MRHCLSLVTLGALLLPFAGVSQQAAPAPAHASAGAPAPAGTIDTRFAAEPLVLRDAKLFLRYNADGTGERSETQTFSVQSEGAVRNLGVIGMNYAAATQTAEFVYVRVRHTDGTTVETPLTDVQDQTPPVTQNAPFYSDLKQKQIPVRGLRLGDIVEWKTHVLLTKPEAPNQFWGAVPFVRGIVTLNQEVELRVPAGMAVNVWTDPANHVTPQHTTAGKDAVYHWQWSSLESTVGKEAEAAKKAKEGKLLTADEELNEREGRLSDIAFTTFPDWAAVGAWYRSLETGRIEPDAAIRARVAEITAGSKTEADKVRAVYDWVASDIRYVGVALGVGRYQPHPAATVLENQYGDCKDKHTLLASMLLALGEKPDAVLIGAGVRFNAAVPSPAAFNHLITRLTLDGKPVWLDTTSEVAAFQVLIPALRDKEALVVPSAGPARLERTPGSYPFAPYSTMTVKGALDKDLTSDSEITFVFHDDDEIGLRSLFRQVSPSQYPEFVQKLMASLGFGGTTSEPVVENLLDQEKPLTLRFHYHRVHSPDWGTNRITTVFAPTALAAVDEKSPPTSTIRLGTPRVMDSIIDMELPDGWSAELPEAVHQQLAQVRIDTTYRLAGHTLHAERKTTVLNEKVPAADWKQYHKWYMASDAGSIPYIQLLSPDSRKPNGPVLTAANSGAQAGGTATPAKPKTQADRLAEAARLVASGGDKLGRNDVDGAEVDLNAAKELNANQEHLWGNLGVVALRHGNQTEAARDYRKEVELYPKSDFAWRNLVRMQIGDNRKAAEATAREWIAASPETLEPHSTLVEVLWAGEGNAPALTAAKEAATALPAETRESNPFQLLLGQAQLRGGDTAAGAETLSHLIQSDASPLMCNDADYELAKNKLQLPLVEATQRDALKKLAAETLSWTGDESPATLSNASVLLSAAWDTMGWILFQEGKFAEAEPYFQAAWRFRPNPEIGEHLGDVQAALHRQPEADRSYQLADFTAHGGTGTPTLKKKAEEAARRNHDALGGRKPADLIAEERTFALPGQNKQDGTALYAILFTRDQVLHVRPAPGGTTPAQDAAVRDAKLGTVFPPGESAALFHSVALTCKGGSCTVRLEP